MSHAAFLSAIRANPDDDTARLVYADFLDEQGGPADAARAEFIRLQTRLAALDEADPARAALEDRENELLRAHERAWLGQLRPALAKGLSRWTFERGFVSKIGISAPALADHGGPLFDRHPIATVRLDTPVPSEPGQLAKLANRRWWERVRHLRIGEPAGASIPTCEAILTSPRLAALRRLTVSAREVRGTAPRLADVLSRGPWLAGLEDLRVRDWPHDPSALVPVLDASAVRRVRLSGCVFTVAGLAAFLSSDFAGRPCRVELADGNLGAHLWPALRRRGVRPVLRRMGFANVGRNTDVDLPTLLSSPAAANLEALDASETRLSGKKVLALASSGFLRRASEIGLTRCHVGVKTMAALAKEPAPRLRKLKLGETGLRTAGVQALCGAEWCDNLTHLDLMRNALDDDALVALARSGKFVNVRRLDLRVNSPDLSAGCKAEIGDRGVAALADAPNFARLRHLNLYRTRVTAKGVDAVLNGPHWRISELELGGYDLGADLVNVLAKSPRLARLTRLGLSFTPALGGDALLPLAESPHLSPLCHLDIRYNNTSDRVRALFAERLGRRLEDYPPVGAW
ncbi:MAG: TIGR02996 domain-containing protein [Planctomycetes bacterium]|nr:TIGR02996 domain-containing protein [Planctomycetota bacterium]